MPTPSPSRRRTPPRQPRARRSLSRESIIDAAMEMLAKEGLDSVTMRRVAERLDTGPASLYAHVQHKDDLVDELLDRVIGEIDLGQEPDSDRWQEQLKYFARETRAAFGRHGDIARATVGVIPTGANALLAIDWMLGVLRAGGVPDQVAAWSADIVALYVSATATEEAQEAQRFAEPAAIVAYHDTVHETFRSLDPQRLPNIAALAAQLTAGDGNDRFEFGLDMLVRGIASTVVAAPRRRR